jgi:hypothetical protein
MTTTTSDLMIISIIIIYEKMPDFAQIYNASTTNELFYRQRLLTTMIEKYYSTVTGKQ